LIQNALRESRKRKVNRMAGKIIPEEHRRRGEETEK